MTDAFHSLTTNYRSKIPFWTVQQRDAFDRSYNLERYYLAHRPRCGKSKIIVDTDCYHYHVKDSPMHAMGALIIAWPAGAHVGWVVDAYPESFVGNWRGMWLDTNKLANKSIQMDFKALCAYQGFTVLAVSADSLIGERTRVMIGQYLAARKRVSLTGDEISFMTNTDARRTKIMQNISHGKASQFIVRRRALDGEPTDHNGPLPFYNQIGFLGFDILGYENEVEYRHHYAEIVTRGKAIFWSEVGRLQNQYWRAGAQPDKARDRAIEAAKGAVVEDPKAKKRRRMRPGDWWEEVASDGDMPKFKNMDEFHKRLDPWFDRVTFEQCFPNSKRPVYRQLAVALTDEQRRVYDTLKKEYEVELHDGTKITATHHLARVLRLQQVVSNYFPETKKLKLHEPCEGLGCEHCDDTGIVESVEPLKLIDPTHNPKMEALATELSCEKPTIVWARFRQDIDLCMAVARDLGRKVVQYDGRVSPDLKLQNRLGFQRGDYDTIVCNQAAASRAIPLFAAKRHIGISNIFSFRTRRQMDERAEHGAKDVATDICDIVGKDTVDDLLILPALRQSMDVSRYVLKDEKTPWL